MSIDMARFDVVDGGRPYMTHLDIWPASHVAAAKRVSAPIKVLV
jgi:hypothetical protein